MGRRRFPRRKFPVRSVTPPDEQQAHQHNEHAGPEGDEPISTIAVPEPVEKIHQEREWPAAAASHPCVGAQRTIADEPDE